MLTATCTLCVSDFWHKRDYWQIKFSNECNNNNEKSCCTLTKLSRLPAPKSTLIASYLEGKQHQQQHLKLPLNKFYKRLYININADAAFYVIREILESPGYRQLVLRNFTNIHQLDVIWLQITPAKKHIIDFKWNSMVQHSLWEHIDMDTLMSWLSTLGGGFSALGEQFSNCAQTAGKISMKQLSIGLRIGDPFLQARCKLYYSLSLIQTGKLRTAKYIVRDQYRFALNHREIDERLVKMCLGIWLRVQNEYKLRHERRLAGGDSRKGAP